MEGRTAAGGRDLVGLGLIAFGVTNLALAAVATISPSTFHDEIGPFGPYNDHYVRDAVSAFEGSLGVAMLVAVARPSWRIGVLGYALFHYAFHAINHLVDIGDTDPGWYGPVEFALIAGGAVLLAGMLRMAVQEGRAAP
jgi:hypothetical protein